MATFLRMLGFLRPYWRRCIVTALCIAAYALLSGVSVLSVSPFIRILFESRTETGVTAPGPPGSELVQLPEAARDARAHVQQWVETTFLSGDRAQR